MNSWLHLFEGRIISVMVSLRWQQQRCCDNSCSPSCLYTVCNRLQHSATYPMCIQVATTLLVPVVQNGGGVPPSSAFHIPVSIHFQSDVSCLTLTSWILLQTLIAPWSLYRQLALFQDCLNATSLLLALSMHITWHHMTNGQNEQWHPMERQRCSHLQHKYNFQHNLSTFDSMHKAILKQDIWTRSK